MGSQARSIVISSHKGIYPLSVKDGSYLSQSQKTVRVIFPVGQSGLLKIFGGQINQWQLTEFPRSSYFRLYFETLF